MSGSDLTPVLAEQLQSVLQRFDALEGILVSTVEGVPLLKVTSLTDTEPSVVAGGNDFVETVLPTVFAGVAEQIGKLRFGVVQSVSAFYGDVAVLHINAQPLVVTLVASQSAQIGALHALVPQLRDALAPLKKCVESSDIH
ncbi:hypothetical protein PINS_up012208 [Pythium insidiosum]|nr:hypothetical protein PINS_up012208 [Pythium insidiosum]